MFFREERKEKGVPKIVPGSKGERYVPFQNKLEGKKVLEVLTGGGKGSRSVKKIRLWQM